MAGMHLRKRLPSPADRSSSQDGILHADRRPVILHFGSTPEIAQPNGGGYEEIMVFDTDSTTERLELVVKLRHIRPVEKRPGRNQAAGGFERRLLGKGMPDNANRHR